MKKKIIIVTVYNSENCGSFWQAYALKAVLEEMGNEVRFLKRNTRGTSHELKRHFIAALKKLIKFRFDLLPFVFGVWFKFERAVKKFDICDESSDFFSDSNVIVLGSDTIWNFDAKYFENNADLYTGHKFAEKKVITYAASAGDTSRYVFNSVVHAAGGLDNISAFLVRDNYTRELLFPEAIRKAHIVCDPTLLLEKDFFIKLVPKKTKKEMRHPFILLYYFDEIDMFTQEAIKKYAAKYALQVVSFTKKRSWCDYSIPAEPFEMLWYFNNAFAVITNTFHGCAFSMIFEKPFAVHDEDKNKISELLECYNQTERLYKDPLNIEPILEIRIREENKDLRTTLSNYSKDLLSEAIDGLIGN